MAAIAIVGIGCEFPDARSPGELWENVLARRRAFRRIPDDRVRLDGYEADERLTMGAYRGQAAVLEGYTFDRYAFHVSALAYRTADPAHWLALDCAARALRDAGFENGAGLPHQSTGVILGNTLTGDYARSGALQLRWPFVRRVLEDTLTTRGDHSPDVLSEFRQRFLAPFEPPNEETLAGALSNTIAGRIANHFGLQGGAFVVDGACASSLLAISMACSALAAGDLDVVLAGGVDVSLDPFELVGFARAGALAKDEMRVFDRRAEGFWPGEGCGVIVLMRARDAGAQGRRSYAQVRGWGISSDGHGGIVRPEAAGQQLALERAYRRAGVDIGTVGYFEAHGTGTRVGDDAELTALLGPLRSAAPGARFAGIGSIKANIGHTKAAAGVAGLIKAAMAVHTRTLPPTTGCHDPHPIFRDEPVLPRPLDEPRPWPSNQPVRASCSAMGFGGINTHVVLEDAVRCRRRPTGEGREVSAGTYQDAELLVWAAADRVALRREVSTAAEWLSRASSSDLTDLAVTLQRTCPDAPARAAVVARTPAEAAASCARLRERLEITSDRLIAAEDGSFTGCVAGPARIGFLFPGHGAPIVRSDNAWARRFERVAALYREWPIPDVGEDDTRLTQHAIVLAALAGLRVLELCNVTADIAVGHSLGELPALAWAGAMDASTLMSMVTARADAMRACAPAGAMAVLMAAPEQAEAICGESGASLSGYNGAMRTSVSGTREAIDRAMEAARAAGVPAVRLGLPYPFHSSGMAACADHFGSTIRRHTFSPLRRTVSSTIAGGVLSAERHIATLLTEQFTTPVRFSEALAASGPVDIWIEVGSGCVLSSIVRDVAGPSALPLDTGSPSLIGYLRAVAAAFVIDSRVDPSRLAVGRFSRPVDPGRPPRFLTNPCDAVHATSMPATNMAASAETASAETSSMSTAASPSVGESASPLKPSSDAVTITRHVIAERTALPVETILAEHRLLDDLHLSSFAIGLVSADVARALAVSAPRTPTELANLTVRDFADIIASGQRPVAEAEAIDGVAAWARPFVLTWEPEAPPEQPWPGQSGSPESPGRDDESADDPCLQVRRALDRVGGGRLLNVPDPYDDDDVCAVFSQLREIAAQPEPTRVVILHRDAPIGALARTLHLEAPQHDVLVLDVAGDHSDIENAVLAEVRALRGFADVRLSANQRFVPRLRALAAMTLDDQMPLSASDVMLVTGGASGIAAECTLALARISGASLAVIGRSTADAPRVRQFLARCEESGVRAVYHQADVTEGSAIASAVAAMQAQLGAITAVLHGAAINEPCRLTKMSDDLFCRTLAVKTTGARYVLAAVDAARLKLFVSFGSIIARAGLHGEGHYGAANEGLAHLTRAMQSQHPGCRCLNIEWSVWAGAGMGERLGSIAALERDGVQAITLDQGLQCFLALVRSRARPVSVIVSSRIRSTTTLSLVEQWLPIRRFLDRVRIHVPGVELIAETDISAETDSYLQDHAIDGVAVLPAVMAMEAMAQAAGALMARADDDVEFTTLTFEHAITVPPSGAVTLRVAALTEIDGSISLVLRTSATRFVQDHARGRCRFVARSPRHEHVQEPSQGVGHAPDSELLPAEGLYGSILFHGDRFRCVSHYQTLHATRAVAKITPPRSASWMAHHLPDVWDLGAPDVRDAALHAVQACVPFARLVPTGANRVRVHRAHRGGPFTVYADERTSDGATFIYDLVVRDHRGSIAEEWHGLTLAKIGAIEPTNGWPQTVVGPWIERHLPWPGVRILCARIDRLTTRRTVLDALARAPLARRSDGRPDSATGASIAYAGELAVAAVAPLPVGCDAQLVDVQTDARWAELLGATRTPLVAAIADRYGEPWSNAATRVWCAAEALRKVGLPFAAPIVLGGRLGQRLDLRSGEWDVITLSLPVAPDHRILIVSLAYAVTPVRGRVTPALDEDRRAPRVVAEWADR
jgi:enediyne polyketide synthase